MNELIKYVVGIDVAKDKLDVCLISLNKELNCKVVATHKFANTINGFTELLEWREKHFKEPVPVQTLMEASGVYHEKLAIFLTEKHKQVYVVLPNKARKFMQAMGLKSKNDKIDAQGLARMCAQHKFDAWSPLGKYYYELRLLTRQHQNLQETTTSFKNQLHALNHSGYPSKQVSKQLEKTIEFFNKQLKEIKQLIDQHISKDEEVKRKLSQICKVKGLSILSVATILAETNGFELFKNNRQVVSYSGYDVVENQSGNHFGKTKISKKGNSRIRRILHMPALVVVTQKQRPFVQLYERVYSKTGIKMKGYVAVQKKLLIMIYTLWKKDEAYQPDYLVNKASGNEELGGLSPLFFEKKFSGTIKEVVLPEGSTKQDEHRYNESHEVLSPL